MEIKYKILTMDEAEFKYKPEFDYQSINKDQISYQFAHEMIPNKDKGNSTEIICRNNPRGVKRSDS